MRKIAAVLSLAVLAGCSSGSGSSGSTEAPRPTARGVISRAQIEQTNVQDAYEVVQRLRPEFLREQRGNPSMSAGPQFAVVYVDGVKQGGPEVLRRLRPDSVEEIRFINAADATTRWGTGHVGGVIEVKSRTGGR